MAAEKNKKESKAKSEGKGVGKMLMVIGMFALVGAAGFFAYKKMPYFHKVERAEAVVVAHESSAVGHEIASTHNSGGLVSTVVGAVKSVKDTVDELKRYDQENVRLRIENINLRRWAEDLRFNCIAQDAKTQTDEIGRKLASETGTKLGRVLAGIQYRPPAHLTPQQLHTLGVSYFKAREHEKTAVIMTYLTGMEDNDTFKTPEDYLMAGIAWYRLDHLKFSDGFFDKVLEFPNHGETLQYQAQARLWKSMVAERSGEHKRSQKWLRELLEEHSHSIEAEWVNRGEADLYRLPAFQKRQAELAPPQDPNSEEAPKEQKPELTAEGDEPAAQQAPETPEIKEAKEDINDLPEKLH